MIAFPYYIVLIMFVIVSVERYALPGIFICKELTFLYPDASYRHFLFSPPENFKPNTRDIKYISYAHRYLSGLGFSTPGIPYNVLDDILKTLGMLVFM